MHELIVIITMITIIIIINKCYTIKHLQNYFLTLLLAVWIVVMDPGPDPAFMIGNVTVFLVLLPEMLSLVSGLLDWLVVGLLPKAADGSPLVIITTWFDCDWLLFMARLFIARLFMSAAECRFE